MVFTDPPYNVAIDGNVSGLGKVRHREFAMASGEMTRAEFTAFLSSGEMLEAGAANYGELKNMIVWVKDNGDAAGRVGHAARHISKSSSNACEGQSNCQASHEPKKDAQFQGSHYLDPLLEVRAARHTETVLFNSSKSPDPIAIRGATSAIKFGAKV